jgi:uncharacterized membrane protein
MRRPAPWIHRFSRPLIGLFAALGVADTAYLTSVKFAGGTAACPVKGCSAVLSSPYANIFDVPLSLFGLLAYLAMMVMSILPLVINAKSQKKLHNQVQDLTWLGLFLGGTGMMVFSGYLMYLLAFVIKLPCPYCVASATFATIIFILVLIGKEWDQIGSMVMNGFMMGFLTLLVTVGMYSTVATSNASEVATTANINTLNGIGQQKPPYGWIITSQSGTSEIALAEHLKKIGAKMYGSWTCSHCHNQKQLFGREAFKSSINYIECAEQGENVQRELCDKEVTEGFPTWSINGKTYPGARPLEELAKLSGYTGPTEFRYSKLLNRPPAEQ